MAGNFRSIFSTSLGTGEVRGSDQGITKLDFPDMNRVAVVCSDSAPECEPSLLTEFAAELLRRYFSGEQIEFRDIPVDFSGMQQFRQRALTAIRNIPYGEVRSYGQVAAMCESPRAARAIGGVMASNPVPVIVPCHRIIGGNGHLTGFSAPGGETVKMMLLKMEGVEFKGLLVIQKQLFMNR
jgi:methylated-DNA-[protein]-cysteine S-methyltransferase